MSRCWIVCEDGNPTGMVFTDEAKAKEYVEHANSENDTENEYYLEKGYLE